MKRKEIGKETNSESWLILHISNFSFGERERVCESPSGEAQEDFFFFFMFEEDVIRLMGVWMDCSSLLFAVAVFIYWVILRLPGAILLGFLIQRLPRILVFFFLKRVVQIQTFIIFINAYINIPRCVGSRYDIQSQRKEKEYMGDR